MKKRPNVITANSADSSFGRQALSTMCLVKFPNRACLHFFSVMQSCSTRQSKAKIYPIITHKLSQRFKIQTLPHVASHANATTISLHMGGTLYHHEKKTTKKTKSVSQNRTPPFPQVTACATQHHNHNAPKQLFFFFFFFTILNSFLLLLTWDPLPRTLLVPLRT